MQSTPLLDLSFRHGLKIQEASQIIPASNVILSDANDPDIRIAAKDFETAFIAQMLKFSGLGEAITTGGGEDVAAFTDFYIQSFAEEISDSGGFGLADTFYSKLIQKSHKNSSIGTQNVKY